jgi:hypothetical protein
MNTVSVSRNTPSITKTASSILFTRELDFRSCLICEIIPSLQKFPFTLQSELVLTNHVSDKS